MKKNIVIVTAAQVILAIIGYLLNWILTSVLPLQVYGQLMYVVSLTSVFIVFSNPGLSSAIFKSVVENHSEFIPSAYKQTIKYSLSGSFLLMLIAVFYFIRQDNPTTAQLAAIAALIFPFMYLDRWNMTFLGRGEFAKAKTFELIYRTSSVVLAAAGAILTKSPIVTFVCMFTPALILNPVFIVLSLRKHSADGESEGNRHEEYRKYAFRITKYSILPTAARHLDKILLANIMSFSSLSVYYIAAIIPGYLLTSLNTVANVPIQKWLGFGKKEGLGIFIKQQINILILSAMATAALYMTLPLLLDLFGDEYMKAIEYAQVLSLQFLFFPYSVLYFTLTKYTGDEHFVGRGFNILCIIKTAAFALIIPVAGIKGLVWTNVAAEAGWFAVAWLRLQWMKKNYYSQQPE